MKKEKKYHTLRVDSETYEALRKLAFKTRRKLIDILRDTFVSSR